MTLEVLEVVAPVASNIKELMPTWRLMSSSARQARGFFPNEIWLPLDKADGRAIIGARRKTPRSDFGLNERAVCRGSELDRVAVFVWLLEVDGTVVARDTVQNVWAKLANHTPIDGMYGRYWWISSTFDPATTITQEDDDRF